jgi:hypothetical protein
MTEDKKSLLGRLRGALQPKIVAPEPERIRHTAAERRELIARVFGDAEAESSGQDEQADARNFRTAES